MQKLSHTLLGTREVSTILTEENVQVTLYKARQAEMEDLISRAVTSAKPPLMALRRRDG